MDRVGGFTDYLTHQLQDSVHTREGSRAVDLPKLGFQSYSAG